MWKLSKNESNQNEYVVQSQSDFLGSCWLCITENVQEFEMLKCSLNKQLINHLSKIIWINLKLAKILERFTLNVHPNSLGQKNYTVRDINNLVYSNQYISQY